MLICLKAGAFSNTSFTLVIRVPFVVKLTLNPFLKEISNKVSNSGRSSGSPFI